MSENKKRAADKTVLGVSMPKILKERIARLADADHRNMAQWAVVQLEKIVNELEAAQQPQMPPLQSLPEAPSVPRKKAK